MARSRQNRGQDVPAPDPGYRTSGGRLYYFDEYGRAVWVQDDTGTQAARPAEQAWQPPLQGPGNVRWAHSTAAMDPRAHGSGGSQDPRVQQVQNFAPSMQDSAFQNGQPASPSSTMTNFGSYPSTAGSYLSGIDTSLVQVSSHTRDIDDSNANHNWRMDQFVENQTVPVGMRTNPPSLSIEVVDAMELYDDRFREEPDRGRHGRHLGDSDENERGHKRRKAPQTKSKDEKKRKPKDDGKDKKKSKDDRKEKKKPKDDRKDQKKNEEPTE